MAEMDNTTSGIIWQWLSEHRQDVLDYFATIMRDASDIQLVNFDADRHMGLLATFVYQGVRRVDNVKPSSLVEGFTKLNEELRIRCEAAAAEAERQGTYAKTQGDRADECIAGYQALYTKVKNQGDTAEQQGANAQSICDAVTAWYPPFKRNAEDWIDATKATWNDWYPLTKRTWDNWYAERLSQWVAFYTDGVVPTWNAFWDGVQADWADWTAKETARQRAELERIANELLRVADEKTRQANEQQRQANEQQRQANEEVRLNGTIRQNVNTGKYERLNQRTGEWEETENYWLGGLIAYRFYTDPKTGRIHVVKNNLDRVNVSLVNGRLRATYID